MNCPCCKIEMETCKPFQDYACPKCGLCAPISVICWIATMRRRLFTQADTIVFLRTQLRARSGHV